MASCWISAVSELRSAFLGENHQEPRPNLINAETTARLDESYTRIPLKH
jgi:hypothetical protein